jgi:hypothetical protein
MVILSASGMHVVSSHRDSRDDMPPPHEAHTGVRFFFSTLQDVFVSPSLQDDINPPHQPHTEAALQGCKTKRIFFLHMDGETGLGSISLSSNLNPKP